MNLSQLTNARHMLRLLQAAHQCVRVSIGDDQGEGDQEHFR